MLANEDGADCSVEDCRIAPVQPCGIKAAPSLLTFGRRYVQGSQNRIVQRRAAGVWFRVWQILEFRFDLPVGPVEELRIPAVAARAQLPALVRPQHSRSFCVQPVNLAQVNFVVRCIQPWILGMFAQETDGEPLREEADQGRCRSRGYERFARIKGNDIVDGWQPPYIGLIGGRKMTPGKAAIDQPWPSYVIRW